MTMQTLVTAVRSTNEPTQSPSAFVPTTQLLSETAAEERIERLSRWARSESRESAVRALARLVGLSGRAWTRNTTLKLRHALVDFGPVAVSPVLEIVALHRTRGVQDAAETILTDIINNSRTSREILVRALSNPAPSVRASALRVLATSADRSVHDALERSLQDASNEVRDAAACTIASLADAAWIGRLQAALDRETDPVVRESLESALEELR